MRILTPSHAKRPRAGLRPAAPVSQERFDREYWLARCEGYKVDTLGGRLGFVEEIRGADGPQATLMVRAGRLGTLAVGAGVSHRSRTLPPYVGQRSLRSLERCTRAVAGVTAGYRGPSRKEQDLTG
jgi:hypothetical protein